MRIWGERERIMRSCERPREKLKLPRLTRSFSEEVSECTFGKESLWRKVPGNKVSGKKSSVKKSVKKRSGTFFPRTYFPGDLFSQDFFPRTFYPAIFFPEGAFLREPFLSGLFFRGLFIRRFFPRGHFFGVIFPGPFTSNLFSIKKSILIYIISVKTSVAQE